MAAEQKVVRKNRKGAVTRELNTINRFMSEDDIEEVKRRFPAVKDKFKEFENSHIAYHDFLTEEKEIDDSEQYFDDAEENYIQSNLLIKDWLKKQAIEDNKTPPNLHSTEQGGRISSSAELFNIINLPKIEIEKFDGNPATFHSFFAIFDEHVHNAAIEPSVKLTRLLQYTSGNLLE